MKSESIEALLRLDVMPRLAPVLAYRWRWPDFAVAFDGGNVYLLHLSGMKQQLVERCFRRHYTWRVIHRVTLPKELQELAYEAALGLANILAPDIDPMESMLHVKLPGPVSRLTLIQFSVEESPVGLRIESYSVESRG